MRQKIKLNQIFGAQRKVYNTLVDKSKDDAFDLSIPQLNKKYRYLTQKNTMVEVFEDYIVNNPEECFNSTYRDFLKGINSTKELSKAVKNKTGKGFVGRLSFKSKKDPSNSIEIGSRGIKQINNNLRFWPTFFNFKKNEGLLIKEKLPELNYSCRLQRLRTGQYYLCIPINKKFKQTKLNTTCALDPGVRTFQTLYDPDGAVIEFGTNLDKIMHLCMSTDKIQSKMDKLVNKSMTHKQRKKYKYRLRKKRLFIYRKIKNCISDVHHKISKWISENYNKVLLPDFQTKQMSKKIDRCIGNKSVRSMMTWSHYKFKKLLEYKMDRTGGKVIKCTEEYTSKTCTRCGRINHKLGSNKTYKCSICNLIIDRDINAARNIYIRNYLSLD